MGRNFVCGDTHGSERDTLKMSSRKWPEGKTLTKEDVLFQLGDFGWIWYPLHGFNKEQDNWLDWIANKPWTTAVVLGNHENYDIIATLPWTQKWGNDVQYYEIENGNRIYFLKRGAIYEVNGQKILAIGGAHSIDKGNRIEGQSWWRQEDITQAEIDNCLDELSKHEDEVDFVLTHTCPDKYVTTFVPQHLLSSLGGKRHDFTAKFLEVVNNQIKFHQWHFGHFHMDKMHIGINGDYMRCHYMGTPFELELEEVL